MTSPINCQAILNEQNVWRTFVRLKARVKLSQEPFLLSGTCGEIITYTVFNCNVILVEKHENELLTGPIYSQIIPFWQSLIYKAVKAFLRHFAFSVEALSHYQRCTGRILKADFLLSQLQSKSILNHFQVIMLKSKPKNKKNNNSGITSIVIFLLVIFNSQQRPIVTILQLKTPGFNN